MAFVRLAINPLDMPSFERVAGLSKGVGTKTAEKIYHVAAQGDFDALRKACTKYPDLWSDMLLLDKLREHNLTPAALIEMVIEHYTPRLQAIFPDDWPRRQQGLSELAHIASAYTDLEQFVADLSLETPEDDADEFDEAGRVVLSTIHSSKGLEWDAVILLDLVEDRFPSRHALVRPEDFEEERRLMYVACTRAREDLELFVPATLYSRQNGGNEPATPSPFVRELPFSALEEWQEGYTGRISKRSTSFAGDPAFSRPSLDIPRELANPNAGRVKGVFPPPVIPEAKGDRAASKGGAGCGYCRHKVFGRGKIVEQLPPDQVPGQLPRLRAQGHSQRVSDSGGINVRSRFRGSHPRPHRLAFPQRRAGRAARARRRLRRARRFRAAVREHGSVHGGRAFPALLFHAGRISAGRPLPST